MRDIVKSDMYFVVKKIKYTVWGIVACYILSACDMVLSGVLGTEYDLSKIPNTMMNAGLFMLLALICLDSYYVGQIFQTRLINQQVIRAGRTYSILSKYCLVCLFNLLFAGVLYLAVLLTAFCLAGGNEAVTELMNKKHTLIMIICLMCIFIRFAIQFVSITVLTRSSGLGGVANYLYLVLPATPAIEIAGSDMGIWEFTKIFALGQVTELLRTEASMRMLGKVAITSIISIVLWLFLTIFVFRKSDLR